MTIVWTPPLLDCVVDQIQAWNEALALAGEVLPLGNDGWSYTFSPREVPDSSAWIAEIGLEETSERFLVHVTAFPFRALFEVDLETADLITFPNGLRQALYEGMFFSIRDHAQLERLSLGRQALLVEFEDHAAPDTQWLDVRINHPDGIAIDLILGSRRSAFTRLVGEALPAAPSTRGAAGRIKVAADTIVGSIGVSPGDLRALEPGAVVVLTQRPHDRVSLCIQDTLFDFEPTDGGWRCLGQRPIGPERAHATVHMNGDLMNKMSPTFEPDESDVPEPDAPADLEPALNETTGPNGAVALAHLRIGIDFDIGRCLVPVETLSQWNEGTIVMLDAPTPQDGVAVTIRANGEVVGCGDIVRIDDRIAVRVTRFDLRA